MSDIESNDPVIVSGPIPRSILSGLDHVHTSSGVCVKNRYGPKCSGEGSMAYETQRLNADPVWAPRPESADEVEFGTFQTISMEGFSEVGMVLKFNGTAFIFSKQEFIEFITSCMTHFMEHKDD
jgi:hypothetical protein